MNQQTMVKKKLIIELEGRLDSDNSASVGKDIAERCEKTPHEELIFQAEKLTYITSAGLRVLFQIIKDEQNQNHASISIINVSHDVYEVLKMTGLTMLVNVQKA